jgi:hypothetical protein
VLDEDANMEGKVDGSYVIATQLLAAIWEWRAEGTKCQQPFALGSEPWHVPEASPIEFGRLPRGSFSEPEPNP